MIRCVWSSILRCYPARDESIGNHFMQTHMTTSTSPTGKTGRRAKIAIIGGGSLFCAELVRCFILHINMLKGCHITLMDIDTANLDLIYTISTRLLQQAGADLTLERTTVLEDALEDADFVLTTFRTGGLQARLLDEKLPLQYGLLGHDTVGPGGFFYALRTAPVVAGIAATIEKVAPKAFLLNYTTPSTIITEAIAHSSGIRVIGLSNSPARSIHLLARMAGVEAAPGKRLYPRTVGLNHGNWTTSVWREGVDVLPQIVAWCENYIADQPAMAPDNYALMMLITLTAHYKAIPSYHMHHYYFPEQVRNFLLRKATSPAEDILAKLPSILAQYREESRKKLPQLMNLPEDSLSGDYTLDVLRSILNDTGEEWVLNVQNNGSINFIDDDRVVEVPCRVDARGVTPLAQGDGGLELDQTGLIALLAEYEGATARAALWGTRREAIKALASNPLVMSYSKAEQIYDVMAVAHARYLPERLLK
ncbi:MAG: hypothetical protein J2P37_09490 [Ktedonobacteraceae bacterium]|nr:hypothetical protein [Ktedonobacteraceae bacterium]